MSKYLTGSVIVKCSYDLLDDKTVDTDVVAKLVAADVKERFTELLDTKPDFEGSPAYTLRSDVYSGTFEDHPYFTFKVEVPVDTDDLDDEKYINQAHNTAALMVRCVRAGLGYAEPFPGL